MNILNLIRRGLVIRTLLSFLASKGIVIQPYYLYVQVPEEELDRVFSRGFEEYEGFFIELTDLFLLNAIPYADLELYRKRLIEGKICYALRHRGRFIAFSWFDLDECSYEGEWFLLKRDESYNFDSWVEDRYRGRQISGLMRYKCHKVLARMGRTKMYSFTEYFNTPGLRSRPKNLARKIKLGLFVKIPGFSRSFALKYFDCGLDLSKPVQVLDWRAFSRSVSLRSS